MNINISKGDINEHLWFVAESDLRDRCICIGLPPAPGKPGYCPKHPDR